MSFNHDFQLNSILLSLVQFPRREEISLTLMQNPNIILKTDKILENFWIGFRTTGRLHSIYLFNYVILLHNNDEISHNSTIGKFQHCFFTDSFVKLNFNTFYRCAETFWSDWTKSIFSCLKTNFQKKKVSCYW